MSIKKERPNISDYHYHDGTNEYYHNETDSKHAEDVQNYMDKLESLLDEKEEQLKKSKDGHRLANRNFKELKTIYKQERPNIDYKKMHGILLGQTNINQVMLLDKHCDHLESLLDEKETRLTGCYNQLTESDLIIENLKQEREEETKRAFEAGRKMVSFGRRFEYTQFEDYLKTKPNK